MKNTPFSRLIVLLSAVFLIAALVITVQASGTTTTIVEVDDEGNVGIGTSVAINSQGEEIIAYHDFTNSSLKVAVCDTDFCTNPEIETVDNDGYVGEQPDLVINSQDRPVISHYDRDLGDLRLTVCDDPYCTTANTQIVDDADNVGINSSIVLDAAGRPVISYYDATNRDLKIAYCNDLACAAPTVTIVDAALFAGLFSSLALDDNGLAVIAYYEAANANLQIAFCNDETCSAPTIKMIEALNDSGQYPSLALVSGRVYISYFHNNGGPDELKLARCNDAACNIVDTFDVIDTPAAAFSSMVVSQQGQAFMSLWDETEGDLVVVACMLNAPLICEDGTFTRADRFHITGLHTDITLNQEGSPVISYYDQEEEALNLATCRLCRVPTRNDIGPAANEDSISLVVTEVGYPILTYQDNDDNNFYLVYCQDTVCDSFKKTSLGTNLHINPSMALQENGRPAVAYYHASTNELKYTACLNGDCTDSKTNVIAFDGYDPTLRFDSNGLPVISYYDAGNDDLMLARCSDIECSAPLLLMVDGTDSVGSHTSMVLTAEDFPIISYYDQTNDTIKYAVCDDEGCTNPFLNSAQATDGPYNALALSESGRLYIAFYNNGQSLSTLECNLPCESWGIGTLDNTTANLGWDISIAIAEDGYALVSYYDVENGVLRMATCHTYACSLGATLGVIDTVGGDNGRFSQMVLNGRGQPVIAHANLTMPSARVLVYDTEPILHQLYTPVVLK